MYEIIVLKEGYTKPVSKGLMQSGGSVTLLKGPQNIIVDTGSPWDRELLLEALQGVGLSPTDVGFSICTHGGADKVGNLNLFPDATHIVGSYVCRQGSRFLHGFEEVLEIVAVSLKSNDVPPDKINYVICTHGHSDHVGNLNLFQSAIHIVSYDICKGDQYIMHDFAQGIPYEIDDFVEIWPTPGHTGADVSVIVKGSKQGIVAITAEKDMLLLGMLASSPVNNSDITVGKPSRQKKREHQRTTYMVSSRIVCRETFKFMHGISQNKLTALLKHYLEHGLTPRQKQIGGRKCNTNAIQPEDTKRVVRFITNFTEDHGLVLPGRVPGFKRSDIKILPSAHTKASIWRHYCAVARARGDLFECQEDLEDPDLWQMSSEQPDQQEQSRIEVLRIADYIVPGHGPMFQVPGAYRKQMRVVMMREERHVESSSSEGGSSIVSEMKCVVVETD